MRERGKESKTKGAINTNKCMHQKGLSMGCKKDTHAHTPTHTNTCTERSSTEHRRCNERNRLIDVMESGGPGGMRMMEG